MASFDFSGIGVSHLYGCVPKNKIQNRNYTKHFSPEIANAIVDKTGIEERRFVTEGICASDLSLEAAKKLVEDHTIDKEEIKFLIFVSQTPDHRMPATAILLQEKLGLGKDCMAFDLSLGCSGFVYGLSVMFGLINSSKNGKGLLLVGETRSRVYSPQDRKTAFLFGDAGVACLIEKDKKYGTSHFDLFSDGSSGDLIKMDAGGYRMPSSNDTLRIKIRDDEGNARSDEHGYMDGSEVFNFVLQHIPKSVRAICKRTNHELSNLNPVVFHQANLFMNKHLLNKLKIEDSKVLSNVSLFGNTSSVSIPLAIVTEYKKLNKLNEQMALLCGFGVGMSWANAILKLEHTLIGELIEC